MVLTFRAKLLLAMMLVVTGVTLATSRLTSDRVERTYQRNFERQARLRADAFLAVEEARLGAMRLRCGLVANGVRVQQILRTRVNPAVESGEPDKEGEEILYQTAQDELRDMLGNARERTGHTPATFFRFLDATGRVVQPGGGIDAGLKGNPATRANLDQRLAGLIPALTNEVTQQVGYLPVTTAGGQPLLTEVVFTRIVDPVTGEGLGALVVGFPVPLESAGAGQILTGIQAGGELFTRETNAVTVSTVRQKLDEAGRVGPRDAEFSGDLASEPFQGFRRRLLRGMDFPSAHQVDIYSMAEVRQEQAALRARIFGLGLAAIAVAFIASFLIAGGLTGSIRDLVRGTREIERGNFKHTVRVRSRDEIGQLAGAFNEMAKGLADKEYYRSVLDKVADPSVAAELAGGKIALGGELRQVSVIFCDIRGFTKLTENMAPEEVIHMLNEHFTPLTRVVDECHGMVDKFVGDLVMAVFGAPKSYGDDAVNAARCARRMIEERVKLNQTSRYQIEVGIGVASGAAVAGNMGSEKRLNYTVLGERVNLAARLCSKAGRMEVVIDQTTRDLAVAVAQIEPITPLELKGFSAPVPAYKLLAIQPVGKS